jgi:hypothetical protein
MFRRLILNYMGLMLFANIILAANLKLKLKQLIKPFLIKFITNLLVLCAGNLLL